MNGQLKGRAFQMIDQDFQIVWLDEGVLRRVAEEIVGMANDELIEWRRRSHEHRARTSAATPGASGALPGCGDGAGIAGHHHGVQRANIDAQFHSGSRDNAANAPVPKATLDFAALAGKIATAI